VVVSTFFTAGIIAVLVVGIRGEPPLVVLFLLVWSAFAGYFIVKSLCGATQIQVFPGGRVRIRDWFKREHEVAMIDIKEIRLQGNLLTIKTTGREFYGCSGFDGLHRFVHDAVEHNSGLVTKGI
jgi:hypothetical protein